MGRWDGADAFDGRGSEGGGVLRRGRVCEADNGSFRIVGPDSLRNGCLLAVARDVEDALRVLPLCAGCA